MDDVEIISFKRPWGSSVAPLILKAYEEVGQSFPLIGISIENECNVLCAQVHGKPVGFICWNFVEWRQEVWIDLAYTLPEMRGRGIYSTLYVTLEEEAAKLKARSIAGAVNAKNPKIIALASKQGRIAELTTYRKYLPFIPTPPKFDED